MSLPATLEYVLLEAPYSETDICDTPILFIILSCLSDIKLALVIILTIKLEEMSEEENTLMETLDLKNLHIKRPKFRGVGLYN